MGADGLVSGEAIEAENRRLRYLRTLVDLAGQLIVQGHLGRREAEELVEATRSQVLRLFPGKEATYDLIYRPRFERLLREFSRRDEEG
jgi:hypothetical protein